MSYLEREVIIDIVIGSLAGAGPGLAVPPQPPLLPQLYDLLALILRQEVGYNPGLSWQNFCYLKSPGKCSRVMVAGSFTFS